MREKKLQLIVTFHTTAAAMAMEKHCKASNLPGRLMPVPRALTSDCGIAWCSGPEQREAIQALVEKEGLETAGLHEILI